MQYLLFELVLGGMLSAIQKSVGLFVSAATGIFSYYSFKRREIDKH